MSGKKDRPSPRRRWENVCLRCGLCCYEREKVAGGVRIDLSRPCPYLDNETLLCTVYRRRFRVARYCAKVTFYHALFGRRMPLTCGYVQRFRFRSGRRERGMHRE